MPVTSFLRHSLIIPVLNWVLWIRFMFMALITALLGGFPVPRFNPFTTQQEDNDDDCFEYEQDVDDDDANLTYILHSVRSTKITSTS